MEIIRPLLFGERWLPITKKSVPKVKEGLYMVSNTGRVISYSEHRIHPVEKKAVMTNDGYLRVNLRHDDGSALYYLLHRIVAIEFNPIPGYQNLQINHFDGNKTNNNLWNLQWCTCSENIIHAYKTGLKYVVDGEKSSAASITNEQAFKIAEMIISGKYKFKEIADIIGCTPTVITQIATGQTWGHVLKDYDFKNGKYKKQMKLLLDDTQIHMLCKYFEDHKSVEYRYKTDMYKDALLELFGIEYDYGMSATMSRIYNRVTRTDISSQYDF